MKIIKKIKRFLGLELPHLLEDEEEAEVETKHNVSENFYKSNTWENIEKFNKAMNAGTMTMNETREMFSKIGRKDV